MAMIEHKVDLAEEGTSCGTVTLGSLATKLIELGVPRERWGEVVVEYAGCGSHAIWLTWEDGGVIPVTG